VGQHLVIVHLRDGSTVSSEEMSEEAAKRELERIVAEEPRKGNAGKVIQLGRSAAFRSLDFIRAEIEDAPLS
jgi:hypothetical protein